LSTARRDIPPPSCQQAAGEIGEHVSPVTNGTRIDEGPDHFEEDGPDHEMKADLSPTWGRVSRAKAEMALKP